jgi:hypothetical protein
MTLEKNGNQISACTYRLGLRLSRLSPCSSQAKVSKENCRGKAMFENCAF